jgi:hypothetical protein
MSPSMFARSTAETHRYSATPSHDMKTIGTRSAATGKPYRSRTPMAKRKNA